MMTSPAGMLSGRRLTATGSVGAAVSVRRLLVDPRFSFRCAHGSYQNTRGFDDCGV